MKRKLSSIIAALFILVIGVFATGCGNKYKKMEFQVLYAYSADAPADQWFDGTNGISLNYDLGEIYLGGERSSLIFDDGEAHLFVKVVVKNVKAKHVGDIMISPTSYDGIRIAPMTVKQNQVIDIPIEKNVNTSLSIYESNSSKSLNLPISITHKLTEIDVDTDLMIASTLNKTLNLKDLNNLTFNPTDIDHKTNQTGVVYSVESIGSYDAYKHYSPSVIDDDLDDYAVIEDNKLFKIVDVNKFKDAAGTINAQRYVVRIKVTSDIYDGVDGREEISSFFDVYLVEDLIDTPVVQFADGGEANIVNLYANNNKYSTSTIQVGKPSELNSLYAGGLPSSKNPLQIVTTFYVKDSDGVFKKYDFTSQNGINGLLITPEADNNFKFSMMNTDNNNEVKVAYEIAGLDFIQSSPILAEQKFYIYKDKMPVSISVNDVNHYYDGDTPSLDIPTSNVSDYKGYALKLDANPNANKERIIELEYDPNKLIIVDTKGKSIAEKENKILVGTKVFVKFKDSCSQAELTIKTSKTPEIYNGKEVEEPVEYISFTYTLTRVVTADSFEFVNAFNSPIDIGEVALIDAARNDQFVRVKINYSGNELDPSTISLSIDNPNIKFTKTGLRVDSLENVGETDGNGNGFVIFKIGLTADVKGDAKLSIYVNNPDISVESKTLDVKAIFTMGEGDEDKIDVVQTTTGVRKFTASETKDSNKFHYYFAVPYIDSRAYAEFEITAESSSNAIAELTMPAGATGISVTGPSTFTFTQNTKDGSYEFEVTITYYDWVNNGGINVIQSGEKVITVYIAVYNPIAMIDLADNYKNEIGYINSEFENVAKTEIGFETEGFTKTIEFESGVTIGGASQIKAVIDDIAILTNNNVEIKYLYGGVEQLLTDSGAALNGTSGKILVQLTGECHLKDVKIRLQAMQFGVATNISSNIVINIQTVDKAQAISVTKQPPTFIDGRLEFSFMNSINGEYVEKTFPTSLEFETLKPQAGHIRVDNIEQALTYITYVYDNTTKSYKTINNDYFRVTISNGMVGIKAYTDSDGGHYKIVLATNDSYKPNNDGVTDEKDYETTYPILIDVVDGEVGSEYRIRTVDDLRAINNNLDKHFVLAANLTEVELSKPLGYWGDNDIRRFTGSLSGKLINPDAGANEQFTQYSIGLTISNYANLDEKGNLYGLFAIIGTAGEVKDLIVDVKYNEEFINNTSDGSKIGTIAGINLGTIKNSTIQNAGGSIKISQDASSPTSTGQIDFGGIVAVNEGTLEGNKYICESDFEITSEVSSSHNIGLIAGHNKGTITGSYQGKESLNNYVYDVVSNLNFIGSSKNNFVGSVAGLNEGVVENILAGGQIEISNVEGKQEDVEGAIGGLVGKTTGEISTIRTSTVMSLNVQSLLKNVKVGGIVGSAHDSEINYVKFVSANSTIYGNSIAGQVKGAENIVGGVVGYAANTSVSYSSVENFVDDHFSVEGGATTGGLVGQISEEADDKTTISISFVSANIKSSGKIYLISSLAADNTYFIGKVVGSIAGSNATYSVVNPTTNPNITKPNNINWGNEANYNVIVLSDGTEISLPYLMRLATEKLQIIAPRSISADLDQDYITEINSSYVGSFSYDDYDIEETVVVNFFAGAEEIKNTHNLFNYQPVRVDSHTTDWEDIFIKNLDGTFDAATGYTPGLNYVKQVKSLLDISLLPPDAQGGFNYEIIGTDAKAYINFDKQIVFTGPSGHKPIIVRIYSSFNPACDVYVAFYTQTLFEELTLKSTTIKEVNQPDYKYEITAYTGQAPKVIQMGATNDGYSTLFDVKGIEQFIAVSATTASSKLVITTGAYNNLTIKIKDGETINPDEYAIITFTLKLRENYFDKLGNLIVPSEADLGSVKLKVNLANAASNIAVNGTNLEISSKDDFSFKVTLTTDFIDKNKYYVADDDYSKEVVETIEADPENNQIFINKVASGDFIKLRFDILSGSAELARVLSEVNKTRAKNGRDELSYLWELFDIQMISSLHFVDDKAVGYKYDIKLELKNEYEYKHLIDSIKFNIYVYADSNEAINNEDEPIQVLIKPTQVSTVRMESYNVTNISLQTNYSDIVTNSDIQTSIIQPGSNGNVLMIYLEPTFANITSARIKTSSLYVPSLGKNVQMTFTQLVLDKRVGTEKFVTLFGTESNNQNNDGTLELETISEIDEQGERIFNGVLCVLVQLEEFYGLEATITATVEVESENETISREKNLLTTYRPKVELKYNEDRKVENGYLIQQGTSENQIDVNIYGYQFNSNPRVKFEWLGSTSGSVGDYVSYYLKNSIKDVVPNDDGSYTMPLYLNVSETITAPFKVNVSLTLTSKDGELYIHEGELIFYPTDYILNEVAIKDLPSTGRKNIAISKTKTIELDFLTDNYINEENISNELYEKLLDYVTTDKYGNAITDIETIIKNLGELFTFYNNGTTSWADEDNYSQFEFKLINKETMAITGIEKFNKQITFTVNYYYNIDTTGLSTLAFGNGTGSKPLSCTFTLYIYAVDQETEIAIYGADELYDSNSGKWLLDEGGKYVLMNDIVLKDVVPCDVPIRQLDGNNKIISIESFKTDVDATNYGLFASIGKVTVEDKNTNEQKTYETILKNVVVDYSNFTGTLAFTENKTINFGGLVGVNNGGLIYNCDVINKEEGKNVEVNIVVPGDSTVNFGGLVGVNSGIITNSRVGRQTLTRITATADVESNYTTRLGGLTFKVLNKEAVNNANNNFAVNAGAFVGVNSGTISTSYVSNTNLINYSTHEKQNKTAGFVATNSGEIHYSYVKADEKSINIDKPRATGYKIENKGNGIVAGFVYDNSKTITNSYVNTELETHAAYVAGFVYHNQNGATISECYSAATMGATAAEQPFVGVDKLNHLLSDGVIENSYYLMRNEGDEPKTEGDKSVAYALNEENFQEMENLTGFTFVLSNSQTEREQGTWSYYTLDGKKRVLPELMNTNVVAHSYRYIVDPEATNPIFTSTVKYFAEGSMYNPHIISSVEDFNRVFAPNRVDKEEKIISQEEENFVGHVRFINNINFKDEQTAILTRVKFKLGNSERNHALTNINITGTSVEGNGLNISGIYIDVDSENVEKIGLFAEIENAYVKNLNLNFATPSDNGQFSTSTAIYSGGLAGTIKDSAIINIDLAGNNTRLIGKNFVGGLAGMISGTGLIHGITTNLNVTAGGTVDNLYYNERDFKALNIGFTSGIREYTSYLKSLSYAGGVAGVIDLNIKSNMDYNVLHIDVLGNEMTTTNNTSNIIGMYAGGIAGYAGVNTHSLKLRYFIGSNDSITGTKAVGGLYGVALGEIMASQVANTDQQQYNYDTNLSEYVIKLKNSVANTELTASSLGNVNLLKGENYIGGLVGISLDAKITAGYSKVGIASGKTIGGLVGLSVAGSINYSYSIPYIDFEATNIENAKVGGLIGSAYKISTETIDRNKAISIYEKLLKQHGVTNKGTDIQFVYSTLIVDNAKLKSLTNASDLKATYDYVCADFIDRSNQYLYSSQNSILMQVYVGTVNYDGPYIQNQTSILDSAKAELGVMMNTSISAQGELFNSVFSSWSLIKYWSLKAYKYFPTLNSDAVNNYIIIDSAPDFEHVKNNPKGKFKVVKDITIPAVNSNWVVSDVFRGILVGQKEGDSTAPTITINGLNPTANDSAGFFKETYRAQISNINFCWNDSDSGAIKPSADNLTTVSGLICKDSGESIISNVEVRVTGNSSPKLLNTAKTITGFGGIVGEATNTHIIDSKFIGNVDVNLTDGSDGSFFGGIVGTASVVTGTNYVQTTTIINGCGVGSTTNKFGTTEFNISVSGENESYIGGIIGKATNVSASKNTIGGGKGDYEYVKLNINLVDKTSNTHIGGLIGHSRDCLLSNNNLYTEITTTGTQTGDVINVGGLAGYHTQSSDSTTMGISGCFVKSNISTYKKDLNTGEITGLLNAVNVRLSAGVAEFDGSMYQCLFSGKIKTNDSQITNKSQIKNELQITNLTAGGAVAHIAKTTQLQEIASNVKLKVGTTATTTLKAGGLVGYVGDSTNITHSVSYEQIIPQVSDGVCYVGGLIGHIEGEISIKKSFTTSTILSDDIPALKIAGVQLQALIGSGDATNIENVFYSTDLALTDNVKAQGTNLSMQAMLKDSVWHSNLNEGTIWQSFTRGAEHRLPYITSLEEKYLLAGILAYSVGKPDFDYVEGSVMRPQTIVSPKQFNKDDAYKYYFLQYSYDRDTQQYELPKLSGILNGILIAQNNEVSVDIESFGTGSKEGDFKGIIPVVEKYSAVSNLHANVQFKKYELTYNTGIIVGANLGTIFNCSVAGSFKIKGDKTQGEKTLGLITAANNGLVSHCHSSAEIQSVEGSVGGIVHSMNSGSKMISSYFVGYIEQNGAGLVYKINDGYLYNNYMGGVVNNISKGNAFYYDGTFNGAKNYIDSYSDIEFKSIEGLTSVPTLNLMNNKGDVVDNQIEDGVSLAGNWYTPWTAGIGHNYNYPIYDFRKQVNNSGALEFETKTKYHLYTGTGDTQDSDGPVETSAQIYGYLVGKKQEAGADTPGDPTDDKYTSWENYNHAFKIPHLGILSTVNNLSGKNFVIIYDLDGKDTAWTAPNFSGVVASNKYFGYTEDDASGASYCTISNLKTNGMFGAISNAYIGSLKFGSFMAEEEVPAQAGGTEIKPGALKNSGALGVSVTGATTINNIIFNAGAKISVSASSDYAGGLFGSVEESLTIEKFVSNNVTLTSSTAKIGLIAGSLEGSVSFNSSEENETYDVQFNATGGTVGGLIGEMQGGSISGNVVKTIKITPIQETGSEFNWLAGVVGSCSSGENEITNIKVELANNKLVVNNFGGIVGIVNAETTITNCSITATAAARTGSGTTLELRGKGDNAGFYSLLIGQQTGGTVTATGFAIENISTLDVGCDLNTMDSASYDENKTSCGVGLLAGGISSGSLTVTVSETITTSVKVVGVPNVGAVAGYFTGATLTIDASIFDNDKVNVSGTTNVGGVIGHLDGALPTSNVFGTKISTVLVDGSDGVGKHNNFGGLVGYWENVSGTYSSTNNNPIDINEEGTQQGYISNVGGVAGKITASGDLEGFINVANVIVVSYNTESATNGMLAMNVGGVFGYVKNTKESGSITISNVNNIGSVAGYHNVGGIIGSTNKELTLWGKVDEDTPLIPIIPESATNSNNIYGVLNVGGIIGFAKDSIIQCHNTTANVYGNTFVGGIIGLAQNTTIVMNKISGPTIKAIYYRYEGKDVNNQNVTNDFIPTGIGGIVGYVHSDSQEKCSAIAQNAVDAVSISSTNEALSGYATISVNKNYMANIDNVDEKIAVNEPNKVYTLEEQQLYYKNLTTGFGGIAGRVDVVTATANAKIKETNPDDPANPIEVNYGIASNTLNGLSINAQLGINVGTVYGVYEYSGDVTTNIPFPVINDMVGAINKQTSVDGAYNVGGLIGFIDTKSGASLPGAMNASSLAGNATIHIQQNLTGINVGGVVGRTNANRIGDETNAGITLASTDGYVKLKIFTANSYNVGGIIGRAEVNSDAILNLVNNINGTMVDGDNKTNFGGLIGLLKVGRGDGSVEVDVKGSHSYAFTINTIENENYVEGESKYSAQELQGGVMLNAQAFYINQDTFDIVGSESQPTSNPLDSDAIGWHKEYTGFRILQRCIPALSDANKDWNSNASKYDSIGVLYDAKNITHVELYDDEDEDSDVDDILYTTYRESETSHRFYSRIGIASMVVGEDGEPMKPRDIDYTNEGATNWFLKFLGEKDPSYHEWHLSLHYDDIDEPFDWTASSHPRLYNDSDSNCYSYQNIKDRSENKDVKTHLVYAIPSDYYLGLTSNVWEQEAVTKQLFKARTDNNIYFKFDVVFENSSIGKSNDYLPTSGSIFQVTGIMSQDSQNKRQVYIDDKWTVGEIILAVVLAAAAIVATVYTGGAAAAWIGAHLGTGFFATAVTAAVVVGFAAGGEKLISSLLAFVGYLGTSQLAKAYASELFVQPSNMSYGMLSQVYSRNISYENNELIMEPDSDLKVDGHAYLFYSFDKPVDFQGKLIGIPLKTENGQDVIDLTKIVLDENLPATVTTEGKQNIDISDDDVENGTDYLVIKKYAYQYGQYYKSVYATGAKLQRVTLDFDEGSLTESQYTYNNGSYYIYGEFSSGQYIYPPTTKDAIHQQNFLSYNSSNQKYSINGVEQSNPTAANKSLYYSLDTSYDTTGKKKGYDYFAGIYYTVNGNKNSLGTDGTDRYATFSIYNGDPSTYDNLHYQYIKVVDKTIVENVDTDIDLSSYYYGYDGSNFYKPTQEQIDSGIDLYFLYQISKVTVLTEEPKIWPSGIEDGSPTDDYKELYRKIYPTTFVNPYSSSVITNKDVYSLVSTNSYEEDEDKPWVANDSPADNRVEFKPTYFIYEGGYKVVSITDADGNEKNKIFTKLNIDGNVTIEFSDGSSASYADFRKDFASYSGKTLLDGTPVTDRYYVLVDNSNKENNVLYFINNQYSLSNDTGLLSTIVFENDKSDETAKNLYLESKGDFKKYGFYSRYKYDDKILKRDECWPINNGNSTIYYYILPKGNGGQANGGKQTTFAESVRVIFGGSCIINSKTDGTQISSGGGITIS